MKKIFTLIIASVLLFSCSDSPKKVAKNFAENVAHGQVDEAKKYATEATGKLLDLSSSFGILPVDPNYEFKSIKDSVVDNTAWVTYNNLDGKPQQIRLIKIDGKWLVHLDSKK